jgi:hypothetical protein
MEEPTSRNGGRGCLDVVGGSRWSGEDLWKPSRYVTMGPVTMYHSNCPEVVAHVDFPFLHSGRPHTPKTSMVAVYRRGCAPVKVAELLVPASMC